MIQQARDLLASGKYRPAIPLLKAAFKHDEHKGAVGCLLCRAYLLRSAQLGEKGLITEAAVTRQHALAIVPSASGLDESDLMRLLDSLDTGAALEACCFHFDKIDPSPQLVQKIAAALVTTRRWDLLERMPPALPLFSDSPAAREAADLMHSGDWVAALDALQPVRRSSAYASVRILCRAMACFYAEDSEGMHRALGMIPEGSLFHPIAETMRRDARKIDCLWDRQTFSEADVTLLMDHLKKRRIQPAAAIIRDMGRSLVPEAPDRASADILMTVWPQTLKGQLRRRDFFRLAKAALSGRWARLVRAKFDYYHFERILGDTAGYLEKLATEFPDEHQRSKAASLLLTHTAERLAGSNTPLGAESMLSRSQRDAIGLRSSDPEVNLLELLAKAIDLGPTNRTAYGLVAKCPRYSRESKFLAEAGLERMASVYPEDPFPCLELATLYYEKNAYRKAERVLSEAKRRAPHDPKVADRHVIALLVSMEKRIKGGKLHLAAEDLQGAQDLCSERTLPLVTAKTIRFQAQNTGQVRLFSDTVGLRPDQWFSLAKKAISLFTPLQRLTTLGLLSLDLTRGKGKTRGVYRKRLDNLFKHYRKDIDALTSRELRDLLLPLEKELSPIMPLLLRAGIYQRQYPGLLSRMKDTHITPVLEALVAERRFGPAKKEIRRRLKKRNTSLKTVLDFYLAVIQQLDGEIHLDGSVFEKLVAAASDMEKEILRAAARRLSVHASGRLAEALRRFDFDILNLPPMPWGDFSVPFWDDDDEDDDEFTSLEDFDPEMISNMLDYYQDEDGILPPSERMEDETGLLVEKLETLIDHVNLRGLPGPMIRQIRNEIKRTPPGPWIFDLLAGVLTNGQIENLSREAWEFLFGK